MCCMTWMLCKIRQLLSALPPPWQTGVIAWQVREGLESGGASDYQRQVAQARLLGELYNYRVLDSR